MRGFIDVIGSQIADNWPAFVYILMTIIFSVLFFRERKMETKTLQKRFDAIENLIRRSINQQDPTS